MKRLVIWLLAAALVISCGSALAAGENSRARVWIHPSISAYTSSVYVDVLILLDDGTAFWQYDYIASQNSWAFTTEYTWTETAEGFHLVKTTNASIVRDFTLSTEGDLISPEGLLFTYIDPSRYEY